MNKAGKSKTIEIVFEKCRILTSEPRNPDRDIELKQVPYRAQLATRIRITLTIKTRWLSPRSQLGYLCLHTFNLQYTLSRSPSKSVRSLSDMLWLLSLRSLSADIRQVSCLSDHRHPTSELYCQTTDIRQMRCLSDHRHPASELSCQTTDIRQVSCLVRPHTSGKWAVLSDHRHPAGELSCQATDIRQVSCLVRPHTSGKWAVLSDHRHPASELSVRPQTGTWAVLSDYRHSASELSVRLQREEDFKSRSLSLQWH
jgi:hypothetical protein